MANEFDGGIAEGILPQAFHPLYHIYPFDTPRMLRYQPDVERFRNSMNSAVDDETRQTYVASAKKTTTKMNNVSCGVSIWFALYLANLWLPCLHQISARMQLYASNGTSALNGSSFWRMQSSDQGRNNRETVVCR
jgi:hypothetical protein